MICYETSFNGRKLGIAGAAGYGVLSMGMTWVQRDPARRRRGERKAHFGDEEHSLNVGGLFQNEHLYWVKSRPVRVGDVIRVRVLRRDRADAPVERVPVEAFMGLAAKRRHLAYMERHVDELRREVRALERRERPQAGARASRRRIARPR